MRLVLGILILLCVELGNAGVFIESQEQKIQHVIDTMPEMDYSLYSSLVVPNGNVFYYKSETGTYPLSDRTPQAAIINTDTQGKTIVVASWDMHNVYGLLSPLYGKYWNSRGLSIINSEEIAKHDDLSAKYIIDLLAAGSTVLALQGVPAYYFEDRLNVFCEKLSNYAQQQGISIDLQLLRNSTHWLRMDGSNTVGILCKTGDCQLKNQMSIFQNKGWYYEILIDGGQNLSIINAYYDDYDFLLYIQQSKEFLQSLSPMVVFGTSRIFIKEDDSKLKLIESLPGVVNTVKQNPLQLPSRADFPPEHLTLMLSNRLSQALYLKELKNYAQLPHSD